MLKFVLVKTVIFLTFWQGIVISMVASWNPNVKDTSDQKALQNFMICVEMMCAAFMMLVAFPHTEYHIGGAAAGMHIGAMFHAISIRDVIADVVHQFAPTYHDYVLYSDGGPADNVKRCAPAPPACCAQGAAQQPEQPAAAATPPGPLGPADK
jgi:hypothetical protein